MPQTRQELAARKQAKINTILTIIANHVWQYGYQPSVREIAEELGYASPGYVQSLLTQFIERGTGDRKPQHSRAIAFRWREYLAGETLSWDKWQAPRRNTEKRTQAKRAAKRKLGRVP